MEIKRNKTAKRKKTKENKRKRKEKEKKKRREKKKVQCGVQRGRYRGTDVSVRDDMFVVGASKLTDIQIISS
jgi:hypothetical protein